MGLGSSIGEYFHKLADGFKGGTTAIADIDGTIEKLFTTVDGIILNVQNEVTAFKNFQFNPHWKSRVINVPIAIDQTRTFVTDLADEVRDDFQQLTDDLRSVKQVFQQLKSQGTVSGLSDIINIVNEVNTFLEALQNGVEKFQSLVDMIRKIREEIEGLDSLFLQQGNRRRVVRDRSVIRVGALHE
jgi:uncharacterized phage infection (PIP) family protein YhgE